MVSGGFQGFPRQGTASEKTWTRRWNNSRRAIVTMFHAPGHVFYSSTPEAASHGLQLSMSPSEGLGALLAL